MNKSCAIGCAAILIFFAALAAMLIVKGPAWFASGKGKVMKLIAEEQRISSFESAWAPPSSKLDQQWAPPEIGEWKLKQLETVAGWPDLNVAVPGQRMIYENGEQIIEIGVVAANELEKETLIQRIKEALEAGGRSSRQFGSGVSVTTSGSRTTTQMGNRIDVKINDTNRTRLWWLKDWLFFYRTQNAEDLGSFAEQYLRAIQAPLPVEAPAVEAVRLQAVTAPA